MHSKASHFKLTHDKEKTDLVKFPSHDPFKLKSDHEIWQAFKGGNESAFIHIYNSCYDSLVQYGINFSMDRELIRDCIQDLFIELREKRSKIGITDCIKPYLFVIFRRKINRYLKLKARISKIQIEKVQDKFEFELSFEQKLINKQLNGEQIQQLNQAISKLTNQEREIIFLFFYEGYTYPQISDILGYTKVKTARSLLYKALSALRKTLETSSVGHLYTLLLF